MRSHNYKSFIIVITLIDIIIVAYALFCKTINYQNQKIKSKFPIY